MDWSSFWEGVGAGFAGSITFKFALDFRRTKKVRNYLHDNNAIVTQRDNRAGGDIAGRDINKGR